MHATIFLVPDSASASSPDLLPSLPLMLATTPVWRRWKSKRGFLQLVIDDGAVRDDQDRVEDLLVLCVVEVGEEVGGPGYRVGFARTGGVLDQVLAAGPRFKHGGLQLPRHIELVVAREDNFFDLLFVIPLRDAVAAEDFQPAFASPDSLPEVGRAVAAQGLSTRVACAPLSPFG